MPRCVTPHFAAVRALGDASGQVERAAEALVKHHTAFREKKAKADLLEEDGDEFVFLVVSLTQVPGTQRKPKFMCVAAARGTRNQRRRRLTRPTSRSSPLPHAIRDDTADACMFVKVRAR